MGNLAQRGLISSCRQAHSIGTSLRVETYAYDVECKMLQEPSVKASIVADCAQLIETQVSAKGGMSGLALKASLRPMVKGLIDAGYIPGAIGRLLPSMFEALEFLCGPKAPRLVILLTYLVTQHRYPNGRYLSGRY
jgi:hypothetical protein